MIRESYKKIKDLPGGKFGLFENTSTKKQKTLPLSMADKNGNATIQKNKNWTYNDEIPETPVESVEVQQEIRAETYDLLRNAIEKLKETGKHVDNCGNCEFECRNVCQGCQSRSTKYIECRGECRTEIRTIYNHTECASQCRCESCQSCQGCQGCQRCQDQCKKYGNNCNLRRL